MNHLLVFGVEHAVQIKINSISYLLKLCDEYIMSLGSTSYFYLFLVVIMVHLWLN